MSGSGTNLQALIDHEGGYAIRLVISDKAGVYAIERAKRAGIETAVIEWQGDRSRHTIAVCDAIERAGAEMVVLAGYMRILGPEAVRRFPNKILNVHPALLPAFPGTADRAVGGAIDYGVKVTGVTVHIVDEQVDHGPIVAQAAVPVEPDDTIDVLHRRIQVAEHRLYPEVVAGFAAGAITIEGRTVRWRKNL